MELLKCDIYDKNLEFYIIYIIAKQSKFQCKEYF